MIFHLSCCILGFIAQILPGGICIPPPAAFSKFQDLLSHSRIVGGELAGTEQFPYQLSLRWNGQHFCGAVIIDSFFLNGMHIALTAGHCVYDLGTGEELSPGTLTVMGGSVSLSDNNTDAVQILGVRKIITHEKFNISESGVPEYDISLLVLSGSFKLSPTVRPVTLPAPYEEYFGNLTVSGWGATDQDSEETPDLLRYTVVPFIDNFHCAVLYAQVYENETVITPANFCAGFDVGGKDTCFGDSGGPGVTTYENPRRTVLITLTSWGEGCAQPGLPGVYVKVSSYVNWIQANIPHDLIYFKELI